MLINLIKTNILKLPAAIYVTKKEINIVLIRGKLLTFALKVHKLSLIEVNRSARISTLKMYSSEIQL